MEADDILIFDVIDQWGDSSAEVVNKGLLAAGDPVTVRINSPGGSVFEGLAIYNMLAQHKAKIIVNIEGAALSAASLIAMAGDEIRMAANALLMIHDPRMGVHGTSSDIRKSAETMDKAAIILRDTYVARTGLDAEEVEKMMAEETWFTAEEALEHGFVTEVVESKTVTSQFDPVLFNNAPGRISELVAQFCADDRPSPSPKGSSIMNDELRKLLVALGMDEALSDADAETWLAENAVKAADKPTTKIDVESIVAKLSPKDNTADIVTAVTDILEAKDLERVERRAAFTAEVDANLELVFGEDVPPALQAKCYAADGIEAVRKAIKDAKAKGSDDLSIVFASQQPRDVHLADVSTALQMRSMQSSGASEKSIEKHLPADSRGKSWQNFSNVPLINICRECMLIDGYSARQVSRLSNSELAQASFGFASATSLRNEAIHVTGSLAEITRDAVNKSLLAGYEEAPQTWRGPMRQAASVADFKDIHRIRLGAVPNLPVWPDNTEPEQAKLKDEKVSYAVEARAQNISFSWRLFVNDDMDALARQPKLMGDAAARTVNAVAWAQVTGNPTMPYDSVAFFAAATGNRKRTNLTTGAGAPSVSTVGTLTKLMRLMRGLNTPEEVESDDILNLTPRFIVGPAALETTILQLVRSTADPADDKSSAVYNTAGTLVPIIEPLLDANSATAWYLFADPVRVDTVEVTFLQGQETPMTHDWIEDKTLSRQFTIYQTFEAKAIDHRGGQKHAGA